MDGECKCGEAEWKVLRRDTQLPSAKEAATYWRKLICDAGTIQVLVDVLQQPLRDLDVTYTVCTEPIETVDAFETIPTVNEHYWCLRLLAELAFDVQPISDRLSNCNRIANDGGIEAVLNVLRVQLLDLIDHWPWPSPPCVSFISKLVHVTDMQHAAWTMFAYMLDRPLPKQHVSDGGDMQPPLSRLQAATPQSQRLDEMRPADIQAASARGAVLLLPASGLDAADFAASAARDAELLAVREACEAAGQQHPREPEHHTKWCCLCLHHGRCIQWLKSRCHFCHLGGCVVAPPLGYGLAQPVAAAAAVSLDDDSPFVLMLKPVLHRLSYSFRHVVVVVSDSDNLRVSQLGLQAMAAASGSTIQEPFTVTIATIAVVCASDSGLERELARICKCRKCKIARACEEKGRHYRAIQDRFKLAHGEDVAHAALRLEDKLDEIYGIKYLPSMLSWKENCTRVLACVAKQLM
jgi:hypothetical protein